MSGSPETRGTELDDLFARAKAGDQDAWSELVTRCRPKVLRVVRRKLDRAMRSVYDSTDLVNLVFAELFSQARTLELSTFDELTAHLIHAADRTAIDEYRRLHRGRRDMYRTSPLESPDAGPEPPSPDPSASQIAEAREALDQILADRTGPEREVIELKAQGYSNEEVAQRTGLCQRSIQRLLKNIRESRGGGGI